MSLVGGTSMIALVPDAISNSTAPRVLSGAHEVGQALLRGAQPELRRQVPLQQFEGGRDLIASGDAGLPANADFHRKEVAAALPREQGRPPRDVMESDFDPDRSKPASH